MWSTYWSFIPIPQSLDQFKTDEDRAMVDLADESVQNQLPLWPKLWHHVTRRSIDTNRFHSVSSVDHWSNWRIWSSTPPRTITIRTRIATNYCSMTYHRSIYGIVFALWPMLIWRWGNADVLILKERYSTVSSKIVIGPSSRISADTSGIRLQSNAMLIALCKRLQRVFSAVKKEKHSTENRRVMDVSVHLRMISIVICDTVPGRWLRTVVTESIRICSSVFASLYIEHSCQSNTDGNQESHDLLGESINAGYCSLFIDSPGMVCVILLSILANQLVDSRSESTRYPSCDCSAVFRKHVKVFLCPITRLLLVQNGSNTKITVSQNLKLVWSTKLHLFLYRFVSSLNFSDRNASTKRKDKLLSAPVSKTFEFAVDACANVCLQLSADCRYYSRARLFVTHRLSRVLHWESNLPIGSV